METITPRFRLREFTEAERLFQTFRDRTSEQPRRNYELAILQRQEPPALVGCGGLRGAGCEVGKAELGI